MTSEIFKQKELSHKDHTKPRITAPLIPIKNVPTWANEPCKSHTNQQTRVPRSCIAINGSTDTFGLNVLHFLKLNLPLKSPQQENHLNYQFAPVDLCLIASSCSSRARRRGWGTEFNI